MPTPNYYLVVTWRTAAKKFFGQHEKVFTLIFAALEELPPLFPPAAIF